MSAATTTTTATTTTATSTSLRELTLTVVATATGSGIGLQLNQGDHSLRSAPLGIERDLGLDQLVRFAGLGQDGSLAVVVPGVASVALAGDGVGLLWVDDATVFFLGAGSFEATPLATNALAAWFVQYA